MFCFAALCFSHYSVICRMDSKEASSKRGRVTRDYSNVKVLVYGFTLPGQMQGNYHIGSSLILVT
jgi:hypothetical protein